MQGSALRSYLVKVPDGDEPLFAGAAHEVEGVRGEVERRDAALVQLQARAADAPWHLAPRHGQRPACMGAEQ